MTTETGKRLLGTYPFTGLAGTKEHIAYAIAAIEAEAVAAERARIAEAVRGLPDPTGQEALVLAAVLTIIEGETP